MLQILKFNTEIKIIPIIYDKQLIKNNFTYIEFNFYNDVTLNILLHIFLISDISSYIQI